MTDIGTAFVEKSRALLRDDYLPKIEACLARLTDAEVWARPNDASNSAGNLILHLCGNVTEWIVGGVGRLPYERRRQQEFDERSVIPAGELVARLRGVVGRADEVIGRLDASALLEPRDIQGYQVSVLDAVYHVVEHFAMHTGQIIVLTKARTGVDLELWEPPPPRVPL